MALIHILIRINQNMTGQLLRKTHNMYSGHLCVILLLRVLVLRQKYTGVNPQTQMHGSTNIHTHTHLLTLPRFICQYDSWTLAEVQFAKQNPSLGYQEPEHPGKHSDTHLEAAVRLPVCVREQEQASWSLCLCACTHECATFQNTQQQQQRMAGSRPSSVSAVCAWQTEARFVRLPVDIKRAYCFCLYLNIFPPLPSHSHMGP